MRRRAKAARAGAFVVLLLLLQIGAPLALPPAHAPLAGAKPGPASFNAPTLLVANWNLQAFGIQKAKNATLMDFYARTMKQYDVIFIDEIRDESSTAFAALCERLPDYNCNASSRAGRTASKEQIGVIYKKGIRIAGWKDFNPDAKNRWERPPLQVDLGVSNHTMRFYAIHVSPGRVAQELDALQKAVNESGMKTAIIGDLNADCSYYPPLVRWHFLTWKWAVPSGTDTTVAPNTRCAYDRILLNSKASPDLSAYGVYKNGVVPAVSDHYLVWAKLNLGGKS